MGFASEAQPASSIYRNAGGRAEVLALYDRAVERLGVSLEARDVATRHGRTRVLVAGPEDAPPVVLFQGGNFLGPLTLAWFRPLMERWRIHAPDTVGHPGRSDETRLSPRDASYGEWAADVLDGLGFGAVPVIGVSYGAGITLRLAGIAPERIARAVLLVPAGVVSPPILPLLMRIVPWMLLYRLRPSHNWLERAARPLFTGAPDPEWLDALGALFRHLKLETRMPRDATRKELQAFHAPTLVLAAENDVFFPGRRVLERAHSILPGPTESELLKGCGHLPDAEAFVEINRRIEEFLRARGDAENGCRERPVRQGVAGRGDVRVAVQ